MHKTVVSSNMSFSIEEGGDGKGRILVAMKDLKPGTVLFFEDRPLLFVNKDYLNRFDNQGRVGVFTAAYNTYSRRLVPKMRWKFMQLHGPTEDPFAESIRVLAKEMMTWENDEKRPFNEKEVHNFVKVASIWRCNACVINSDNTMAVYETASRMSHACRPNCALEFNGLRCVCRVIAPVAKAEELTVEYSAHHRFKPTHARRHIYLEKKDFTCHCPRCDAPADDTRKFRCFDTACPGVHCMCQPLNRDPFPTEGAGYTDVEYTDPRLLPCTVCGTEASIEQTEAMLRQEQEMAAFSFELDGALAGDFDRFSAEDCTATLARIDAGLQQPAHALAGPMLRNRWLVAQYQAKLTGKPEELWASTVAYLSWLNRLHTFPSPQLLTILVELVAGLVDAKWPPALPRAQELCKRALRVSLLLRGREDQRMEFDRLLTVISMRLLAPTAGRGGANGTGSGNGKATVEASPAVVLEALPTADPAFFTGCIPISITPNHVGGAENGADCSSQSRHRQCAFCEESADRAELVLCRCERCKLALYCGPSCQKAHWKAHKPLCVPTTAAASAGAVPEHPASAALSAVEAKEGLEKEEAVEPAHLEDPEEGVQVEEPAGASERAGVDQQQGPAGAVKSE